MLLIRLFSRTFVTNKRPDSDKYSTIVIKEIPKHLQTSQIIEVDAANYVDTDNLINGMNKPTLKLKLVKMIQDRMHILRAKRRKRVSRKVGYKQITGYFQIIE